ncbi:MAG: hypothetical protein JXB47_02195 [Anaerolineae bacterium]|nr:hypothetical protein [Anaerolineae bacterium]
MEPFLCLGVGFIIVAGVLSMLATRYHRVPPNQVMVVYGRSGQRLITTGGVFVWPLLESYKILPVNIMTIKTEKDEVYTVSGVPIRLDWVAQVQIAPDEAALSTAARAFLDKSQDEIRVVLNETLSANFRAIVGQMSVEGIHRDRDSFVQKVQDLASDDMTAMGVQIISMGIEEITDDQGYLQAMAAPQIAAVKRDATVAQAEADREARVKAAQAQREAEQAELDAQREILQQREALELRDVEVKKRIELAQAEAQQEVQQKRALVVEQQQEADVLVPARAEGQAVEIRAQAAQRKLEIEAEAAQRKLEIEAEAQRKQITITADAEAQARRQRAEAEAQAEQTKARAEAAALLAKKEAEAAGAKQEAEALLATMQAEAEGKKAEAAAVRALKEAEAEGKKAEAAAVRALKEAEADGVRASLLAEAEGRRELATASAAEGEITLRQFIAEKMIEAEIAKTRVMAEAMAQAMGGLAGLGSNIRMVHFGGADGGSAGAGKTGIKLVDLLLDMPEIAEVFKAKVEALSGEDMTTTIAKINQMFNKLKAGDLQDLVESVDPGKTKPAEDASTKAKSKAKAPDAPEAAGQ